MSYFVTGATGFIGRFLVGNLLKRKGTIHVLVRKESQKKFDAIGEEDGLGHEAHRARCIGDMPTPKLRPHRRAGRAR